MRPIQLQIIIINFTMDFVSLEEMSHEETNFTLKLHAIDHNMKPCRFMQDLTKQTALSKSLKNDAAIQNPSKNDQNGQKHPLRYSQRMNPFENFPENRRPSLCENNANTLQQQDRKQNFRKKITIQKKLADMNSWNGEGIARLTEGKVVIGTWKNGKPEGIVKMIYATKDIYVGEVLNYQRHGTGTLTFSDGIKYEGGFSYGKFDGYGTLYDCYGAVDRRGIWQRGQLIVQTN